MCTGFNDCFADKTSSSCPAAATGKTSIVTAISDLENPPVFNCIYKSDTPFDTDMATMTYTDCDINEDSIVVPSTGIFTCAKAGKYRFTFMTRTVADDGKKVIALIIKTPSGGTAADNIKIGRSVVQDKDKDNAVHMTTTIDIIHQLIIGDQVSVQLELTGAVRTAHWKGDAGQASQIVFTGNYLRA